MADDLHRRTTSLRPHQVTEIVTRGPDLRYVQALPTKWEVIAEALADDPAASLVLECVADLLAALEKEHELSRTLIYFRSGRDWTATTESLNGVTIEHRPRLLPGKAGR